MKAFLLSVVLLAVFSMLAVQIAYSGDVYVGGYHRKDGTYVRPHIRSSPDSSKWNNYGPSRSDPELMNPTMRDYDRDGIPNYFDYDDDSDGIFDDYDARQYGR